MWLSGGESMSDGRSSSSMGVMVVDENSHDFVSGCMLRAWRLSMVVMNSIASISSSYGGVAYSANVEVEVGAVEYCPVSRYESMYSGSRSVSTSGASWMGNWVSFLSAGAQSRSTAELVWISSLSNPTATWGVMGRIMPGV